MTVTVARQTMDFKDPCNFLSVEAELNRGSMERWLSTVKDGKKSENANRRSDLSIMVKKHLSALGWVFAYFHKGKKRELRYKSPKGRWFYSLATACMNCVDQQIVPKYELSCSPRNLKKRNRVEDFDAIGSASSDLTKIKTEVKVSNKKQKTKLLNSVDDCDTVAFKTNQEKNISVLDVDASSIQQQKKRRKKASEEIIKPRIVKSLKKKKVLQATEKKKQQQNKSEQESIRRKDCGPDKNCDVCCVCHWGGELLLCDGCPSAFHNTCLGFSTLPKEDLWFCPCCCCDICESMESPGNSKLMTCEQCQRRFHLKCFKEEPLVVSSKGWFCSSQCNKVYSGLENLLRCKIAVGNNDSDLVWTLMRAPNEDEHYDDEQISKLDSAVEILHQGFEPSTDHFSGRDLVEELIYRRDGSGVSRGFYTVLIEKNNEPITVAAVRVDKNVAEIPLVATSSNYRRSGMCRVLMDELEKQMFQMGVCRLVLPAAQVVLNTWTQRFGFSVMESSERLEFVKHGMLDFVGTVMCHKFLEMERKKEGEEEDSASQASHDNKSS